MVLLVVIDSLTKVNWVSGSGHAFITAARTLLCAQQAWEGMLRTALAPANLCLWHTFLGAVFRGFHHSHQKSKEPISTRDGSLNSGDLLFLLFDYFVHDSILDRLIRIHEIVSVCIFFNNSELSTGVSFQDLV